MIALQSFPAPENPEKDENGRKLEKAMGFSPLSTFPDLGIARKTGLNAASELLAGVRSYRRSVAPGPVRAPRRAPVNDTYRMGGEPTCPAILAASLPRAWCDGVELLATLPAPDTIPATRWAALAMAAERLLRDHAAELRRAGWETLDLFGLHPRAPAVRSDCMGLAWLLHGRAIGAVAAETVEIMAAIGHTLRVRRPNAGMLREAVPAWSLTPQRSGTDGDPTNAQENGDDGEHL